MLQKRSKINEKKHGDGLYLTLDSSVIVAALRENEEKHAVCKKLLEDVKNGKYIGIEPFSVLIEVVAAIRRRTGNKVLAEQIAIDLQNIDTIHFMELIKSRALAAMEIAGEIGVRGMDAIVIQIAKEYDATLVTLDKEMANKAKRTVVVKDVNDI